MNNISWLSRSHEKLPVITLPLVDTESSCTAWNEKRTVTNIHAVLNYLSKEEPKNYEYDPNIFSSEKWKYTDIKVYWNIEYSRYMMSAEWKEEIIIVGNWNSLIVDWWFVTKKTLNWRHFLFIHHSPLKWWAFNDPHSLINADNWELIANKVKTISTDTWNNIITIHHNDWSKETI